MFTIKNKHLESPPLTRVGLIWFFFFSQVAADWSPTAELFEFYWILDCYKGTIQAAIFCFPSLPPSLPYISIIASTPQRNNTQFVIWSAKWFVWSFAVCTQIATNLFSWFTLPFFDTQLVGVTDKTWAICPGRCIFQELIVHAISLKKI